ncbi:hypothetical protein N7510_010523 [Penicillium lagena]|uniref:uncharacterized protein n=1 Tax=Penicillium lagena TaxID=94218 RepID=UPI0025406826|nr:uncharacterized protein N7510_011821 [Penicillium lagena]XP_056830284.1 uncharacterized protein N7510_010523 [Penicillium lagena]KAJ5602287.1 hypothetical protein N7510_011821 [Penicillium lagena]KAJ5605369.1 hypothetical protein N7510_010523 [Penicillium lagena]
MSTPSGPARWCAVLDASKGQYAAEQVPALLQPVAPITLRARIQRSPNDTTTPTDNSFWAEVIGPCPADELIWQLCYQLGEDPTDPAWRAHLSQDFPNATERFFTALEARHTPAMPPGIVP